MGERKYVKSNSDKTQYSDKKRIRVSEWERREELIRLRRNAKPPFVCAIFVNLNSTHRLYITNTSRVIGKKKETATKSRALTAEQNLTERVNTIVRWKNFRSVIKCENVHFSRQLCIFPSRRSFFVPIDELPVTELGPLRCVWKCNYWVIYSTRALANSLFRDCWQRSLLSTHFQAVRCCNSVIHI